MMSDHKQQQQNKKKNTSSLSSTQNYIANKTRVVKTVVEMLNDRGYSNICINKEEKTDDINLVIYCSDAKKDKIILVFILNVDKIKIDIARKLTNNRLKEYASFSQQCQPFLSKLHLILIYMKAITPQALNTIKEIINVVELFKFSHLIFNITKHKLYMPHKLLNKEEEKEIFNKYKITNKMNLPLLLNIDPVCKYFAYPIGSIIKITRNYCLQPEDYYRIVANCQNLSGNKIE